MQHDQRTGDWTKWEIHVLSEIKRLNLNIEKSLEKHDELSAKHFDLEKEVITLKTRVGVYAATFGFFGSSILPVIKLVMEYMKN